MFDVAFNIEHVLPLLSARCARLLQCSFSNTILIMSYFINKATDLPLQEVFPGITGHLIHTELSTIADFRIAAGTALPEHSHPHEQTSTILEGRFLFTVGGETKELGPGEVAVIPGNVAHSGTALTDCRIMDIFSPVREDYRVAHPAS